MTDYAVVHGDTLMVYSGGQIVARIPLSYFPGLIVELATALRWKSERVVEQNQPNMIHKSGCGANVIHKDNPALPLG